MRGLEKLTLSHSRFRLAGVWFSSAKSLSRGHLIEQSALFHQIRQHADVLNLGFENVARLEELSLGRANPRRGSR